jgi:quinol monooxygenase YgiN
MAIRLVVTFHAKQGMGKQYADAFKPVGDRTLTEAGCEQYEMFRSESDPDKLVLLERWTSQELLDAHMVVLRANGPLPTQAFADPNATPGFERYEVE